MNIVATISTKWTGQRSYRGLPLSRVENYQIDSALDTDTDQFSVDIGDPTGSLLDMLRRDNEVRVSLSAMIRSAKPVPVLKGIADLVALREDGTISVQGRDMSSIAVDTTAPPVSLRAVQPHKLIAQRAHSLGISQVSVSSVNTIRSIFTDGSESEWDFWYRMVRRKQMWIWCGPAGTLHIDNLNYSDNPKYYFGTYDRQHGTSASWIPVKSVEIRKNTQTRVGEVWVFAETGKKALPVVKVDDPHIKEWIRKPLHIVTNDAAITNHAAAVKEANEEIFEGIVGSLEITITIADPGFVIQQNTNALLNLPQINYRGEFFIVGTQILNGSDGAVQTIRLRERKYALTRRVPKDPELADDQKNTSNASLGSALSVSGHQDWGQFFVNAARELHGGWDFNLFLATILAIAQHESSFNNVREGNSGGPEWYPPPNDTTSSPSTHGDPNAEPDLTQWRKNFANSAGNPLNPFSREAGVGPMQLTTLSFKQLADKRGGTSDEYVGGRWVPEANIWVGAWALAQKLKGLPFDEQHFWLGVKAYNGSGPNADKYMRDIRALVKQTYLPQVSTAIEQAQTLPANSTKTIVALGSSPDEIKKIINFAERQEGKPYQIGASGPDKYDCSGLVYAAYHAAGLSTRIGGRQTTWGYWAGGKGWGTLELVKEKAALLPGDMVFFNNYMREEQPGHMGIYYQNGQMIVAPRTGSYVQVQPITSSGLGFMGGMRLSGIWPVSGDSDLIYHGGYWFNPNQ